jgi:hypothetical protein
MVCGKRRKVAGWWHGDADDPSLQPVCGPCGGEHETEHKVENDSGWSLDRSTGAITPWEGIRIFWRFKGERRWRKRVLIPDDEQGQTLESLRRDVPKIVRILARQER